MHKLETLHAFLDREKKNLENLKANSRPDRAEIKKAEQTIKSVQHQLQIQYGEVSTNMCKYMNVGYDFNSCSRM